MAYRSREGIPPERCSASEKQFLILSKKIFSSIQSPMTDVSSDEKRLKKRSASMAAWFWKYVEGHDRRHQAWMTGVLGEHRWLDLVPSNVYPKWARNGNRKRLFRSHVKAYAKKKKAELLGAMVVSLAYHWNYSHCLRL